MSILDNDRQDGMASEMEIASDRYNRGIGKHHTFARAMDVCLFVVEIQSWLYKHWAYAMNWTSTEFSEYIRDSVRDESRTCYWLKHSLDTFSNNDYKYPNPEIQEIMIHHAAPELSEDGKEISHKIFAEHITLPKVSISVFQGAVDPYTPFSPSRSGAKYTPQWPTKGCDLILTDVDTFPRELGYWEDNTFIWNFPVNSVYLYRCPNVDPRILKLPYVKTFEELGWE